MGSTQLELKVEAPVADRLKDYLAWWGARPSRWVANLVAEFEIPDAATARGFRPDGEAHAEAVRMGLLVEDPRPDAWAWQLSGEGEAFLRG